MLPSWCCRRAAAAAGAPCAQGCSIEYCIIGAPSSRPACRRGAGPRLHDGGPPGPGLRRQPVSGNLPGECCGCVHERRGARSGVAGWRPGASSMTAPLLSSPNSCLPLSPPLPVLLPGAGAGGRLEQRDPARAAQHARAGRRRGGAGPEWAVQGVPQDGVAQARRHAHHAGLLWGGVGSSGSWAVSDGARWDASRGTAPPDGGGAVPVDAPLNCPRHPNPSKPLLLLPARVRNGTPARPSSPPSLAAPGPPPSTRTSTLPTSASRCWPDLFWQYDERPPNTTSTHA